jgi:iron complex outermembrane receptor protein
LTGPFGAIRGLPVRWRLFPVRLVAAALLFLPAAPLLMAQKSKPDLSDISLDTLVNTEITSVSRKEEKLSRAAAAVFVISQEDIRRSGLNSIPELLRMVPGITVAQIDANQWAITSRGFNEVLADKMLVLMDGRTLFDPLSSGTYWDVQDTILEDIERIEVIRGPGSTLWGANAVNGVVNIITKKAKDTQGGLVVAEGGSRDGGGTEARYGGKLGDRGFYRIFTKYSGQSAFTDALGHEAADDWSTIRGGFRTDWTLSPKDDLTVQGNLYSGNEGQTVPEFLTLSPPTSTSINDRTNMSGGYFLGRWHRVSSERFDTTVQAYFDRANRDQFGVLAELRHTIDLDFEQHFALGHGHDLVWGGDYRYSTDSTEGSLNIAFDPAARSTNLYGAFIQDQITLLPDRLTLTVGSKLEHNYYSGFALQPNVRLLWVVHPRYTVWMAISGASENSSRVDADIRDGDSVTPGPNGVSTVMTSFGKPHLLPENVVAYQLGQRGQVGTWMAFDVAMFYNHYTNRHTDEPGVPFSTDSPPPLHTVIPSFTESNISGETHGVEISTKLKVTSFWSVTAGYTLFEIHLHAAPGSQDFDTAPESEGSSPRNAYQIRSELNLPHNLEFDAAVYYTGKLHDPEIPDYARVDARFGWRPSARLELSAGVQNLLDPRHFEFGSADILGATQVGRNAYGKAVWRF